jgi:ubiquinone/menaquinone biosynthesis C-methylase UbiE
MAEGKRLTTEDFSNVWKDNCNTTDSGLKLDLVEHLQRQRLSQEWLNAKQRVVSTMKLEQFDDSQETKILDIGCGLGIDVLLVAEEASRLGKCVSIIGLDQNSTMVEESKKLCESKKDRLSPNVSVQIVHGDILQMEFGDETFDIMRSDITLQHVDLAKALREIKRVLKVDGRLIALEAGSGDTYSSDEVIVQMYRNILPSRRDGGPGILKQMLPKISQVCNRQR